MSKSPTSFMRRAFSRVSALTLVLQMALGSSVAALPVFTPLAFANANIIATTGGTTIPANAVGGAWTTLTGPTLTNIDLDDISDGSLPDTIVLNAPTGFVFDTGGVAPTVVVTCTDGDCSGNANENVNNLPSGSSIPVTVGATTLTITITDDVDCNDGLACFGSQGEEENALSWQNVRVRPSVVSANLSGDITRSTGGGNASISGIGSGDSFGTLTTIHPGCASPTIYVSGANIVGGPMNGLTYAGTLIGTDGDDIISSGTSASYIDGMGGSDVICGGNGSDTLNGGDGTDYISGGNGGDSIFGGAGQDALWGDSSGDIVFGGDDDDSINGGSSTDDCNGGPGTDDLDCEDDEAAAITIFKDAQPNDAQNFSFTVSDDMSASFSLDDDSDGALPNVWRSAVFGDDSGSDSDYTITEGVLPSGWSLSSISCSGTGDAEDTDTADRDVDLGLNAGESVTCTFVNALALPTTGTIIIDKVTNPSGDTQSFTFTTGGTGYTGFSLTDAATPNSQTLAAGTYSVSEGAVAGWTQTSATCSDGSPVSAIVLSADETVTCTFTNTELAGIAGSVYHDADNDGVQDGGETGIAGVTVDLSGTATATTTTDINGDYSFTGLAAGTYTVTETQPGTHLDGKEAAGTPAGNITVNDVISAITLTAGQNGSDYDFGELLASSLTGRVYIDANANSTDDAETGLSGVTVALTGTDDIGGTVNTPAVTDGTGGFSFTGLRPSDVSGYTITQTQPSPGYIDGAEAAGTPAGNITVNDVISAIDVDSNTSGTGYLFAEMPDQDNDTVRDAVDNCPAVANTDQADSDEDTTGNACDTTYDYACTLANPLLHFAVTASSSSTAGLYSVDETSGASTLVQSYGASSSAKFNAVLAAGSDGKVYTLLNKTAQTRQLAQLNPDGTMTTTNLSTPISLLVTAMGMGPNDQLYALDGGILENGTLYRIDPTTAAVTNLGDISSLTVIGGDLAIDGTMKLVYVGTSGDLYSIDLNNVAGGASYLGQLPSGSSEKYSSLAYLAGTFYAFDHQNNKMISFTVSGLSFTVVDTDNGGAFFTGDGASCPATVVVPPSSSSSSSEATSSSSEASSESSSSEAVSSSSSIASSSSSSAPIACLPVDASLVAYWKFDEDEGSANDSTVYNNAGALTNGASYSSGGAPVSFADPRALALDGSNDVVTVADGTDLGFAVTDAFSITAWVNQTSSSSYQTIAHKMDDLGSAKTGYLFTLAGGVPEVWIINDYGADSYFVATSSTTLSTGTWHQVGFSYDGSGVASGVKIYADGVDVTAAPSHDTLAGNSISNAQQFEIGARAAGTVQAFAGSIDDLRVYDRVVTPVENGMLYDGACLTGSSSSSSSESSSVSSSSSSAPVACTPTDTGLLAYWKLDEGDGSVLDSSGNAHTGINSGMSYSSDVPTLAFADPLSGSFDGSDEVSVNDGAFGFATQEFTISAFIKPTSGNKSIFGTFGSSPGGYRGWGAYVYDSPSRINFFGYGDLGANDSANTATLLDGNWHHIAGVFSRTGNDLTITTYVDGALAGANTATVGDINSPNPLLLGHYLLQPNFEGGLDDVRVYNYPLSITQVSALAGGVCSNPEPVASSSSSSSETSSSSSEASSSSSSSSESVSSSSAASSSESSSSEAPVIFGLSESGPGDNGNGASRGEGFHIFRSIAEKKAGRTAPGAFGGGSTPFSPQEIDYICSMQRALPADASTSLIRTVSVYMAGVMGRNASNIFIALTNTRLCSTISASLLPSATATATLPTVIPTDKQGMPVSQNLTWNACVRAIIGNASLSKEDIQSNPDVDKNGTPRSCSYYHPSTVAWNYPEFNGKYWITKFSFTYDATTKTYDLPAGYVLQVPGTVASK